MTRLRRAFRNPSVASLMLGIGAFVLVAGARELGLFQSGEFLAFDKFLTWRAGPERTDSRIEQHGGVIDKYMGDGIMAVFGFPDALTSAADIRKDACNAVSCALDMGKELRRLNDAWQTRGRLPVQVRIGISTESTVAGSIGSSDRLEFTLIGDTVNTAERLESFDKGYASAERFRILVAHSTFELLDGKFATEVVQSIKLKGKEEPTTIYRVLRSNI